MLKNRCKKCFNIKIKKKSSKMRNPKSMYGREYLKYDKVLIAPKKNK